MSFASKGYVDSKIRAVDSKYAELITSGTHRQGVWNAETNTPTLSPNSGTNGYWYDVSVEGTWDGRFWRVGDKIIFNDKINKWDQIPTGLETDDKPMLIGFLNENSVFPTTRPSGKPLLAGDYLKVDSAAVLQFEIDDGTGIKILFDSYLDEAEWNGSRFQEKSYKAGMTNEIGVKKPKEESLDGIADYQSDINIQIATVIGKGKAIHVSDKDNIIDSLNYLVKNDGITINRDNNGNLQFKPKTSSDEKKGWRVKADGTWELTNFKEFKVIDTFDGEVGNDYTLYILTTESTVSGTIYKIGFYTWDLVNGFVIRSSVTEVDDDKITYDSNNKLTFKSKTSNDEDKAWKVDQNGDWSLENIGEIVIVDSNKTFDDVKKKENWLYFAKEDINEDWPGLKIISKNKSVEIYLIKLDDTEFENPNFYKSSNGIDWVKWNAGNNNGISLQPNESVYIWNKDNRISTTAQAKFNFVCDTDAQIECSGNIMSMINFENLYARCFKQLFQNCVNLTKAPDLPATQLAAMCYYSMFSGCTNLTTVSELPATYVAEQCYSGMFQGCTNLIVAPEMKFGYTYAHMCEYMFMGCTNLNSIKLHYTGDFDENDAFKNWVKNVSSNGTIYYNGSDTVRGNNAIPTRWTVQTF